MEKVASRKYAHDHTSAFKGRGDKMGPSNRFVRAHRANEERKNTRIDEMAKRRRLPLASVNEQNSSFVESTQEKKEATKPKDKVKETPSNAPETGASRKDMLLKWKTERELKRKAESAHNPKKSAFAVRHVKYEDSKILFTPKFKAPIPKQPGKNKINKPKESEPAAFKHVTRSLASKHSKDAVTEKATTKTHPGKVAPVKKASPRKRVTRQSAKSAITEYCRKTDVQGEMPADMAQPTKDEDKAKATNAETEEKPLLAETEPQSFAPANFNFTAPTGVNSLLDLSKNFRFQPLSPCSAEGFFSGTGFHSPEKPRELITKVNFIMSDPDWIEKHVAEDTTIDMEQATPSEEPPSDPTSKDGMVSGEMVVSPGASVAEAEHGSEYFRGLITTETKKLNVRCEYWEKVLHEEEELSEEVHGSIRTAIGQAKLLITQRFKQFSGLVVLSEDTTAEQKATSSDLQGFWDMIYFQVEDVHNKMDALEKRKRNNWIQEIKQVKKRGKKIKTKINVNQEDSKVQRRVRSCVQEVRAKMRAKMAESKRRELGSEKQNSSFITILTPVKKNKAPDSEVVLTPVRRSLRNTPLQKVANSHSLAVVATSKRSTTSPGLRLTPEVPCSPLMAELLVSPEEHTSDTSACEVSAQQIAVAKETTTEQQNPEDEEMAHSVSEDNDEKETERVTEVAMACSSCEDDDFTGAIIIHSALRSTSRKLRKPRVSFRSPRVESTAGGTPGPLVLTPEAGSKSPNARCIGAVFTPVVISFDTPDTTHQSVTKGSPLRRSSRKRRLPTPYHEDKTLSRLNHDECNSVSKQDGTPFGCHGNSFSGSEEVGPQSKSLRRSKRRSKGTTPRGTTLTKMDVDEVFPDKYLLPSSSEEEDSDVNKVSDVEVCQDESCRVISAFENSPKINKQATAATESEAQDIHLLKHSQVMCEDTPSLLPHQKTPLKTMLFSSPKITAELAENSDVNALLPITPLQKQKRNKSSLTPASSLAALSLDGTPVTASRRDSVFFAPTAPPLKADGKPVDNLICFSPISE